MRRIFLLVLFIKCATIVTLAQCNLTGQVLNEKQQKLAYTTIQLLQFDSTFVQGTTTDSLGFFVINHVESGKYIILASSIGYRSERITVEIQNKEQQLLPITLTTDNIMLGEVEVKASSFIRQKDRILIIPDKQQTKHAGTGYDLLYNLMIPNINVDRFNGKVSTFGGEVTLYIDGRQVDYREIQSLRPKDIEKVEYYDVPTGNYANDIAAINYITKKYKTGGYIALDGKQMVGYLSGDYNVVSKVTHGNTSYTLFGGHNMEKYKGIKSSNHESYLFPDYTVIRDYNTTDSKVSNNRQYGQFNVLNNNERRTLLGKLSLVNSDAPDNYNSDLMKYSQHYDFTEESNSRISQSGLMPSLELYGNFNLRKNRQLETNFQGSYTNNKYARNYSEGKFSTYTHTKEQLYRIYANVKYRIKFKHNNSLAAQLRHVYNVSSAQYTGDSSSWQHLWTAETLLSIEYNQRFGKKASIQVTPGVSSLQYRLHGDDIISQISPRLKLGLTYRLAANQQIQTNMVIGNSHPSINRLNKMDQTIDFLTVKRGNPSLDNAQFAGVMIMYNLQLGQLNIQAAGNYRYYNHISAEDYYVENNKLIHSFSSENNAYEVTTMLSASWKVIDQLNFKLEGNWTQCSIYEKESNTLDGWSGLAQVNYYLEDFACSLYGKTPTRSMELNLVHVYEPVKYGVTLSWNHQNWRVEVGAENLFTKNSKRELVLHTDVYRYNKMTTSQIYQQTGYLKVAYTFDFGRKVNREQNNVNTYINSGILKVE